jgi:hypothetical protein
MYYALGGIGVVLVCVFIALFPDLVRYIRIQAM